MRKFNVRIYFNSFIDYEIEARNEEEAIEIANDHDHYDNMEMVRDNMETTGDADATEIEASEHEMKLALESDGWDWNVLDMMPEWEIKEKYGEIQ